MNSAIVARLDGHRHFLAALAGIALALAYPNPAIAGLAWVAPGLLIAGATGTTGWRSFRIGWTGGLAFHLTTLRWLLNIPVGGFPILGWIALSAFLALYQGAWVWSACRAPGAGSVVSRQLWALQGAAGWVALEMLQARLLSGFPWHLLGVSQVPLTPLIQLASITGVYGVSFLVAWAALCLVNGARVWLARPTARYAWLGEIFLPMGVVLVLCAHGMNRLRDLDAHPLPTVRVAFVQPSIPQTMIWDAAENENRFAQLMALTQQALTNQPQLILWPEAAMPGMLRYDENLATNILGFARSNRVWMIVGSDDYKPARQPTESGEGEFFNASFLINPEGEIVARYCKRNLVMFGEYIPLWRWVSFLKWFTPIESGFTAGDALLPFDLQFADPMRVSTLICFEDVFPHHVRKYVQPDTSWLVNLTNDGWFGAGGEQRQHANAAVFRAIENGVPLLRACNNGLTCWVDAGGRIRDYFRDAADSIHGAGVLVADVPQRSAGQRNPPTFYNRHGDWFGWICSGIFGAGLLARWRGRRHSE